MEKELCFILNKKNIYLEKALISFNEIPVFFLCKDEQSKYYVALCSDIDDFNYVVVQVSASDVYDLLHGAITLREIITNQNYFWDVITGEEIEMDKAVYKAIGLIDPTILPKEGAFFKVLSTDMKHFIEEFDSTVYAKEFKNTSFNQASSMNIDVPSAKFSKYDYEEYSNNLSKSLNSWSGTYSLNNKKSSKYFNLKNRNAISCIA